jgi:Tol biopolymer transport system component
MPRTLLQVMLTAGLMSGVLAGTLPGPALAAQVELVSRAPFRRAPDTAGALYSLDRSRLSADGRFVVYVSAAANLVPRQLDANGQGDVFLYDRLQGTTVLVSHAAGSPGRAGDRRSEEPSISADGGYVAFVSQAHDLTPGLEGVLDGRRNVFLYERATGNVTLVSRRAGSTAAATNASEGPFLSADGSFVGFTSSATDLVPGQLQAPGSSQVFLYERTTGAMTLVSRRGASAQQAGEFSSILNDMSADGRYLAFISGGRDLVAGQSDANQDADVFLFDRLAGASTLVSHQAGSALATANARSLSPSLSADGRYLAFASEATNLVSGVIDDDQLSDVFLYDRLLGTVSLVSRSASSPNAVDPQGGDHPVISKDGSAIAYFDAYPYQPVVRILAFDRLAGNTAVVAELTGATFEPPSALNEPMSISANGRYVAYTKVDGAPPFFSITQAFILDRVSGVTTLVSHTDGLPGQLGNDASYVPILSADGNWVAFLSSATDLVAGKRDSNREPDVFLYERATAVNRIVSLHAPGLASLTAVGRGQTPSVSGDGRFVAFVSDAAGLFPGHVDSNRAPDVFVYDRISKKTVLASRSSASPNASGNAGSEAPTISRDGNYVLFGSQATDLVAGQQDSPGTFDTFLFDRRAGTTTLISRSRVSPVQTANGSSSAGGLSVDGSVVAFSSLATDLVPQTKTHPYYDVFMFDRRKGTVSLVSRSATASQTGNSSSFFSSMSPDGNFIAFGSSATDLVAGVADTNGMSDAFLFQRSPGNLTLLSRTGGGSGPASGGEQPSVSANGRYAAFLDRNRNAVLLDRATGKVVEAGPAQSQPGLSDDGRYVLFSSSRPDVIPGQDDQNGEPDLFVFDRVSGERRLVSHVHGSPLEAGERGAFYGQLSADGRYIVFASLSPDLLPGTLPFVTTIYLYDRTSGQATGDVALVSRSFISPSRSSNGFAQDPVVSARGGFVAFASSAPDLAPGDFNGTMPDVFLYVPDGN